MVNVYCFVCGKEFRVKPGRVSKHNYCSNECMYIGRERLANERVTKITGDDVEGWLRREYEEKFRSVRDIAREVYGFEKS